MRCHPLWVCLASNHVPPARADERREGGALCATFFFIDLDDDLCAFFQHILDADLALILGRWLVVLGRDFLEREESMAVSAKVDEGSSKLWLLVTLAL